MASKDAAAPTNADLFGDTDSSDESVGATTTKSTVNNNAPATANDNDDEAAPQKGTHDEETIREDTKMADDSDEDEAEVGQKKYSSSTNDNNNNDSTQKTDNAALFGDDDSSSEDDEFQDDGIIGTTKTGDDANNNTTKDPPALKTMNQTLGLDSDSEEEDNDGNMKDGGNDGNEDMKKAVYVPPRKMELLNLHPNKQHDASSNNNSTVYHTVKLPNLVGINTTPYNSKTHDAKSEEEYYQGYVHNMIRWRYKYDEDTGELQREEDSDMLVRESNTRLVKWSDGSYTLHVGKEVLEVDNLDSSVPMEGGSNKGGVLPGFSGINGYLYASQKARIRPPTKKELEGPPSNTEDDEAENKAAGGEKNENSDNENENNDDEVPPPTQPGGTVLECLGPISSRFAPRPSSLTSSAHRNLTLAVRQRNVKRARIAEIVTDFDPESEKAKRIKSKDDLAKSSRSAARSGAARRSGGGGGGGRRRGMNASYLEDDDDYDGVNLGRLKRQTMRGDRDNYSDEEEELDYGQDSASSEEDEWSKKKTQKRGAAAARAARKESEDDSSEDGEVVFGDDDDDDDEGEALIKKRVNTKAKAVLDDDDDDE